MDMFSKELYELDKNTVQYMIDEIPDQEIRTRICEQFQISENQVQEFLI
ncbi:MAG: hypothetical protein NC429_16315 [Lachnospiraceae bacterium]|nr:hypothetical protein [Lachnospiraceae bacterium]